MLLPAFDYQRPAGLAEALGLLAQAGGEARPLAGGTDLLVNLKLGKQGCRLVVDLDGLDELRETGGGGSKMRLGALVTAAWLARRAGAMGLMGLAEAGAALGSPQVRNRATIGGNLCTARPAGDLCTMLLALGASAELAGPLGGRQVALADFFQGPGRTVMGAGELLTAALLPPAGPGQGSAFEKLGLRQAMEIALVSAAAWLELTPDGKGVVAGRVALGAVAPTPLLSAGAAQALAGQPADEATIARAAAAAAADAKPIDDHRGSADYRRQMAQVLSRRALGRALAAAKAGLEAKA
ncbi:MAG: FAD binding domain-containing protein [Thermodesulfobacteriota bacterium]